MEALIEQLQAQAMKDQQEIKRLTDENARLNAELDRLRAKIMELESENARLRAENAQLQAEVLCYLTGLLRIFWPLYLYARITP